ncbi:hypothetical protein [Clostridium rectalis]|uniref:hypothetical protein n=1 Tax=Clostridium rectalis TaxID=2040295 RepID=UPI000F639DE5|nr:hypothetical protein [Clostridium rectalis]
MNILDILNKFNMNDCSGTKMKVHFLIGGFEVKELQDMAINSAKALLGDQEFVCNEKGFSTYLAVHEIPNVINTLVKDMIAVYGVIPEVE